MWRYKPKITGKSEAIQVLREQSIHIQAPWRQLAIAIKEQI